MKDVTSREDVELLVRSFYTKVRKNDTLGYIFDDIMKIDWEHHIPILVDFWETMLLDTDSYKRNAMAEHFKVNQKIKLEPLHFSTWLTLFDQTVDELALCGGDDPAEGAAGLVGAAEPETKSCLSPTRLPN